MRNYDPAREEIENIMAGMQCHKDFACHRSGFSELCKARDFGIENYLECLEEAGIGCPNSISFGDLLFCKCPLRCYLAQQGKK